MLVAEDQVYGILTLIIIQVTQTNTLISGLQILNSLMCKVIIFNRNAMQD